MADNAAVEDQSETIEFLSTPAAYGLPAATVVERIDTHGAAVFLVGERVYKLKRAVKVPFMDFSTVQRRRAMCCAELSVNRRTAPALYLGVAALQRQHAGLRLSPPCEADALPEDAVDYVVVMRRFDGGKLLDEVAARGELTEGLADRLAAAVATFHRDAERLDRGGAAALAEAVALDVQQMQARADLLDVAATAQLAQAMPRAAAAAAGLAERRREIGAVRRCHGDLHLGNIFLDGDTPVPFDAIEFNERISCIDTLYDLAFLVMDLDFRGLRPQANRVLNRYLWLAADADRHNLAALGLLPIYLARRGAIRAHVGAANLTHLQGEQAKQERRKALAYQAYAMKALQPVAPRLIAIGGLSGTGKTTLAMALAPEVGAIPGAVVLRSDVIRKRLAGVPLEQAMPPGWYTRENSAATYRELTELARIALQAGHSVVADAVFAAKEERDAIEAVARDLRTAFQGLWLEARGPAMKQRVAARRADASDATPQVVERQLGYDLQHIAWPRVRTDRPLPEVVQAARQLI
jgi:aminoglycoside phosphotransferase family enzyme/predicted kinase